MLKFLAFSLLIAIFVSIPLISFTAEGYGGNPSSLPNPLDVGSISELLEKILKWLAETIAPLIFAGMILIGAYQILFAAGNPNKVKTGKNTILYAVIGYAIILIGWGIASIIKDLLLK